MKCEFCGKEFKNLEEITGSYVCKACRIQYEIDYKLWQIECIAKDLNKLYEELMNLKKGEEI